MYSCIYAFNSCQSDVVVEVIEPSSTLLSDVRFRFSQNRHETNSLILFNLFFLFGEKVRLISYRSAQAQAERNGKVLRNKYVSNWQLIDLLLTRDITNILSWFRFDQATCIWGIERKSYFQNKKRY